MIPPPPKANARAVKRRCRGRLTWEERVRRGPSVCAPVGRLLVARPPWPGIAVFVVTGRRPVPGYLGAVWALQLTNQLASKAGLDWPSAGTCGDCQRDLFSRCPSQCHRLPLADGASPKPDWGRGSGWSVSDQLIPIAERSGRSPPGNAGGAVWGRIPAVGGSSTGAKAGVVPLR